MGDVRKGQCSRARCTRPMAAKSKDSLCREHQADLDAKREAIDARIMASIGRHEPDDELDDDSDLEGESFDDELPLKCPTCGGGDCGCDLADDPRPVKPPPEEPKEESPIMEPKHCNRTGCGKPLRSDNRKGVCSSNCNSSEAPPFARAEGVIDVQVTRKVVEEAPVIKPTKPATKPRAVAPAPDGGPKATLEKFRQLGETLGFDADELLAEFAQSFIDRAKRAVTAPKLALVGEERQVSELVAAVQTPATPPPQRIH